MTCPIEANNETKIKNNENSRKVRVEIDYVFYYARIVSQVTISSPGRQTALARFFNDKFNLVWQRHKLSFELLVWEHSCAPPHTKNLLDHGKQIMYIIKKYKISKIVEKFEWK